MISETNFLGIKHKTTTAIICAIGFIAIIFLYVTLFAFPDVFQTFYVFQMTNKQFYIAGGVFITVMLIFNVFLAIGLKLDTPCPLMIWIIGNILLWNIHLITFLATCILTALRVKNEMDSHNVVLLRVLGLLFTLDATDTCNMVWKFRYSLIDGSTCGILFKNIYYSFVYVVIWMFFIIMVGRHWYVLCDELMNEAQGIRFSSIRDRFRTWSAWSRRADPSVTSRMPQVLNRINRN